MRIKIRPVPTQGYVYVRVVGGAGSGNELKLGSLGCVRQLVKCTLHVAP